MRNQYIRFLFFAVVIIGLMFLAKWLGQIGVSDAVTGGIGFVVAILIYSGEVFIWSFDRNSITSENKNKNS